MSGNDDAELIQDWPKADANSRKFGKDIAEPPSRSNLGSNPGLLDVSPKFPANSPKVYGSATVEVGKIVWEAAEIIHRHD